MHVIILGVLMTFCFATQRSTAAKNEIGFSESDYFNYYDEMAQASCAIINTVSSPTYAVRKRCGSGSSTCTDVCGMIMNQTGRNPATTRMECFNSLHLYQSRTRLSSAHAQDTRRLGLKVFRYGGCGGGCGPNYCCCRNVDI